MYQTRGSNIASDWSSFACRPEWDENCLVSEKRTKSRFQEHSVAVAIRVRLDNTNKEQNLEERKTKKPKTDKPETSEGQRVLACTLNK